MANQLDYNKPCLCSSSIPGALTKALGTYREKLEEKKNFSSNLLLVQQKLSSDYNFGQFICNFSHIELEAQQLISMV